MQRMALLGAVLLCSACAGRAVRGPAQDANAPAAMAFFSTPEDLHATWINAIKGTQGSILMEMFHLTDPDVVAALEGLPSSVQIDIILDSSNLQDQATKQIADDLVKDRPNIRYYPSSWPVAQGGFDQTHTKAMIVDGKLALITSINLTTNAWVQRDYGISTADQNVIAEMTGVFYADIMNSVDMQVNKTLPSSVTIKAEPTNYTPTTVGQGMLIWSPVDSESKLVSLILQSESIPAGPQKTLDATVENLGDAKIEAALSDAAAHGVQVRIIVPQCVLGANGNRNYQFFSKLTNGVQYRVMPHPSSFPSQQTPNAVANPYMHGKMIVLGDGHAYVGSVNYSTNSTQANRELGIIFYNPDVAAQIEQIFENHNPQDTDPNDAGDWAHARKVPAADLLNPPACPPASVTDPTQPNPPGAGGSSSQ